MKLINEVTKEKLRGGFYTPPEIATFIAEWVSYDNKDLNILEPSCGDGAFLRAFKEKSIHVNSFLGIELEEEEANKARKVQLENQRILNKDFLKYYLNEGSKERFNAIVGNPPYIRYQFLDQSLKKSSKKILESKGVKHSRLMNAWVTFVVASIDMLSTNGRVGLVLPAELLQVGYASQIRKFLTEELKDILIITFQELVFKDIQQEVVILLGVKNSDTDPKSHTIDHIEVKNEKHLNLEKIINTSDKKEILDFTNKWTHYFLNKEEMYTLSKVIDKKGLNRIGDISKVEVGITTGANKFFTVTKEIVEKYKLQSFTKPLVGRSVQVRGLIYDRKEFKWNVEKGNRAFILDFKDLDLTGVEKKVIDYLQFGENNGIPDGYKCGIRDKWYVIPSFWKPDAFLLRRNYTYPKLVANHVNAYSTDTMHRVKLNDGIDKDAFAISFYNSVSFAFAEIFGRSYGGGVLEILPSEAESILIPYNNKNINLSTQVDELLKRKVSIEEILDITDKKLLIETGILSQTEVLIFRQIWKKLQNRRLHRGYSK